MPAVDIHMTAAQPPPPDKPSSSPVEQISECLPAGWFFCLFPALPSHLLSDGLQPGLMPVRLGCQPGPSPVPWALLIVLFFSPVVPDSGWGRPGLGGWRASGAAAASFPSPFPQLLGPCGQGCRRMFTECKPSLRESSSGAAGGWELQESYSSAAEWGRRGRWCFARTCPFQPLTSKKGGRRGPWQGQQGSKDPFQGLRSRIGSDVVSG